MRLSLSVALLLSIIDNPGIKLNLLSTALLLAFNLLVTSSNSPSPPRNHMEWNHLQYTGEMHQLVLSTSLSNIQPLVVEYLTSYNVWRSLMIEVTLIGI